MRYPYVIEAGGRGRRANWMIKTSSPQHVLGSNSKDSTPEALLPATGFAESPPTLDWDDIALAVDVRAFIGSQLRSFYRGVVSEPVPERFLRLLKNLDEDSASNEHG